MGVHRVQRVPDTEKAGRIHTSTVTVAVLPQIEETEMKIEAKDLRIDTFCSGGAGGQSVNTTYSAVRIVHLPTKITVSCQNERSQAQNKEMAMKILKSKLLKLKEEELQKEKQKLSGEFQSAEWGNQIRSYVLHPYHMVKDHRTGVETADTDAVLDGDLDKFVEGYLRMQAEGIDRRADLNIED
jgi:peptide chain release factor 2